MGHRPIIVDLLEPPWGIDLYGSLREWRLVMWVTFVVMSVTNVIYVLFATADIQSFNSPEDAERIKQEKEAKKAEKEAKKAGKGSKKGGDAEAAPPPHMATPALQTPENAEA
ncbi:hypothetical protein GE061_003654 [Apolygus lucorum]|uniref:Uncharacterized protein n=1 Tax=Apolygus lucorum TaxID=248454 RepID=A0A6A4JCR0_APOLU|nr:hypothetical protein GE061_003654 [Apolygus lucorum]